MGPGSVLNLLPLPLDALPKCLPGAQLLKGLLMGHWLLAFSSVP